jgi:hypothetical protein
MALISPPTGPPTSPIQYQPGDLLLAMEVRHAHELVRRGIPADAIALLGHWSRPTASTSTIRTCTPTSISGPASRSSTGGGQPVEELREGKPMPDPVKVST